MSTPEIIVQKTLYLPDNLQQEVLDFIDFLINKYSIRETEEEIKIDEYNYLLTNLLKMRSLEAKSNPENVLTSEANRQIIFEKYKWHEQI